MKVNKRFFFLSRIKQGKVSSNPPYGTRLIKGTGIEHEDCTGFFI